MPASTLGLVEPERTSDLAWSRALFGLVIEEIHPDDLFVALLGRSDRITAKQYPQAIAVALALRHSWQREDLFTFSKRLGVKLTSWDLADTPTKPTPDPETPSASPNRPRKTPKRS